MLLVLVLLLPAVFEVPLLLLDELFLGGLVLVELFDFFEVLDDLLDDLLLLFA
ncbi:hypothetical protein [uncultured Clostridium sp.]|uniref:hypothetical protein n=1 Tax=uncultured Clostridium sp. TaxID=59620 RepID=UPI0025E6BCA6|nr:hypothetical protein [uncultured Clostridium sp.]